MNKKSQFSGKQSNIIFSAHLEISLKDCPLVEHHLECREIQLVETQNLQTGRVSFDEYFQSRKEAENRLEELKQFFGELVGAKKYSARVRRIARLDWSESWKKSFHTARVSRRIVIKPSWEKYAPLSGDCVIKLDPGMSFGTGLHPTTRACLRFIDQLAGRDFSCNSFLDAGCGSGVLAIAAAKLGFSRVVAVDFDPQAVKAAKENCRRNSVSRIVHCLQADLGKFRTREKFSVVAANMFESEHERFMENIAGAVVPDSPGYLLVAGTLLNQYPKVVRMYARKGFVEVKSVKKKEWKSGMLLHP